MSQRSIDALADPSYLHAPIGGRGRYHRVVRLPPKVSSTTTDPSVAAQPAIAAPATARTQGRAAVTAQPELASAAGARPSSTATAPSPLLDPFRLPTNAVDAAIAGIQVGQWNRPGARLITASDVEATLDSGLPPALQALGRSMAQALGRSGPLGSHGPLGRLGPVADEPWSPSFWMNKVGDWSDTSAKLASQGGPGSDLGPLGKYGPLAAEKDLDPAILAELRAGGMFAPLGPLGPLGALGALGYLGLVGGHGYARNEDGNFVDKTGKVVHTTSVVDADGKKKSFELVELFPEKVAKAARIHDASWAIKGALTADEKDGDAFRFAAKKGQIITLTVVPERAGDTLSIELVQRGKVVARSESDTLVNWIHLEAPQSGTLEVRVRKKEGASAPAPHPATAMIDWVLSPLVAWGEAVRPWVGAKPREDGTGYRLYSTSTPPA